MKHLLFVIASLFTVSAMAGASAVRQSTEDYEVARDRQLGGFRVMSSIFGSPSAERVKQPLDKVDLTQIPDVGSYSDLEREFKYIRDTRFIETSNPDFPRRMTWLYPDDGCYARAHLAGIELRGHNFPIPKKVFVFGSLRASTKNAQSGMVTWWYHVAVSYRVAETVYIFDPALEPARPLTIQEWNHAVGGDRANVKYSVCAMDTFDPGHSCAEPRAVNDKEALDEQVPFLSLEWNRLRSLKRDPEQELGENPPWLNH